MAQSYSKINQNKVTDTRPRARTHNTQTHRRQGHALPWELRACLSRSARGFCSCVRRQQASTSMTRVALPHRCAVYVGVVDGDKFLHAALLRHQHGQVQQDDHIFALLLRPHLVQGLQEQRVLQMGIEGRAIHILALAVAVVAVRRWRAW